MYTLNNNQYEIGGIPVLDLIRQFGTPLYIYSEETVLQRITELKTNLGVYPDTRFLYAVKANFNPQIVKTIINEGIGIDTVSIDEVKLALHLGCPKENIMYTESMISDAEMRETHDLGILLNIGSLSRLEKWGRAFPGTEICVRFNPDVGAGSHTTNITAGPDVKFGIAHEQAGEVLNIARRYGLKIIGVHEHIGSGWLDYREALLAMDIIFEIARQIPGLKFVDLGGGFGVPYQPGEKRLDLQKLGLEYNQKFSSFNRAYRALHGGTNLQLRFEPGRFFVAESGHLLAEVTTIKPSPNGKIFAGLNTGFNHLVRVAMYGSYHPITNISNPLGRMQKYEVCGNVCESTDIFASARELPEIREGDILSIDIAGAYGMSMAGNYQLRGLPAEVKVNAGQISLIRPRQTFKDLLKILHP